MKKLLLAGALAGAALFATRTIDKGNRTAELWAAATDDLPQNV